MLGFYTLVGLGLSQVANHLANEINNSLYYVRKLHNIDYCLNLTQDSTESVNFIEKSELKCLSWRKWSPHKIDKPSTLSTCRPDDITYTLCVIVMM
jgi:hypothetical protein